MSAVEVRPAGAGDEAWVAAHLEEIWGATVVARGGEAVEATALPAHVAWLDGIPAGLLVLAIRGDACEVVSISAAEPGRGVGTALLDTAVTAAREAGCSRVWLVTTNDNLRALRFYQRRGLRLVAVHRGAVDDARRLKPSIPLVGDHGIPLHDELELALELDAPAREEVNVGSYPL